MRLREQTFPQYFEGYRRLRLVSTIDILALNQEQVETVMTNLIDTEELHLKKISLDWTTASCDVLPSAVVKIESVCMSSVGSCHQLECLCAHINVCQKLKLKKLRIKRANKSHPALHLSSASAEIVSNALVRLEEVNFGFIMSSDQIQAVAHKVREEKDLKLRVLQLHSRCKTDSVPPQELAEAIIRLEKISRMRLTPPQIYFLFKAIQESGEEELKLRGLDPSNKNLAHIPANMLAEATIKLRHVNLLKTEITRNQAKALFTMIASAENLRTTVLVISYNDLSAVPENILVKAIEKLERVNLTQTKLNTAQMTAILGIISPQKFVPSPIYFCALDVLSSLSADLLRFLK